MLIPCLVESTCVLFFALRSERARSQNLFFFLDSWCFTPWTQSPNVILFEKLFNYSGLCTYQCKSCDGGSVGKGRGFDAWDYPPVGRLIVRSDPRVGTFDFDRQKPDINSEAVTKSVPRGFLKVTLLEKGMKLIMSILRKVLSSSSHLIVKLDWNWIPPWKSEDLGSLIRPVPTCWADVIKHFTFH